MVIGTSTTITAVKLHEEVDPGAQCVYMKVPHLLLANMTGGSPSPHGDWGRGLTAQDGCRAGTDPNAKLEGMGTSAELDRKDTHAELAELIRQDINAD